MARAGPRKVPAYSPEFKLTAVRLSQQPGIQVQAVAAALDIHPFMLSKWRKQVRDGGPAGERAGSAGPAGARDASAAGAGAGARAAPGGACAPKKIHPVLLRSKPAIFAFIATQPDRYAVTRLGALYGVTPQGYYAWRRRPKSAHAEQDRELTQRITAVYRRHGGRYGSPRIHEELAQAGCRVSRRRVARLMRTAGLRARVARVYRANPRLHRFYGQHRTACWRPGRAARIRWGSGISPPCPWVGAGGASWPWCWINSPAGCSPGRSGASARSG